MEKAILKTLIYADIFNYPLKGYEVYKWLIGRQTSLIKLEQALNKLVKKRKIQFYKDYYFLKNNKELINKRRKHQKYSQKFLIRAKILTRILKTIPWIKLVGVSGGLTLDNSDKKDDIDLFLITEKNRLWLSRICAIFLFDLLGIRRTARMKLTDTVGKFCVNTILDEDHLQQKFKDLYTAHEVLQMKLLWQRDETYSRFLAENEWVFQFLPNWTSSQIQNLKIKNQNNRSKLKIFDWLENFSKWLQLKLMKKPKGMERIEEGGVYFHPLDYRGRILDAYKKKVAKFSRT